MNDEVARLKRALPLAIAVVLALSAGAYLGARKVDEQRRAVAALRHQAQSLEAQASALRAQRDRVRAERNQLEARLAAGKAPGICPRAFVSTGDTDLSPYFAFDYPCGWHVVRDARPSGASQSSRPGLNVEITFLSRLPISLAPRSGPIADIELADWTDVRDDDVELPPLEEWAADERAAFSAPPKERNIEGGGGVALMRFEGTRSVAGTPSEVVVELWEFEDTLTGARHVMRLFAVAPGRETRETFDRVGASFAVTQR